MNGDRFWDMFLPVVIVAGLATMLVVIVWLVALVVNTSAAEAVCESMGGLYVRLNEGRACIEANVIPLP